MPPSQLRRLKSSLRDQGIVGPQKYKKQKRQANKNENSRIQNSVALQGIREQFNPFEAKLPSKSKYEFASNAVANGRVGKGAISRPGVTKGLGEENVGFIVHEQVRCRRQADSSSPASKNTTSRDAAEKKGWRHDGPQIWRE